MWKLNAQCINRHSWLFQQAFPFKNWKKLDLGPINVGQVNLKLNLYFTILWQESHFKIILKAYLLSCLNEKTIKYTFLVRTLWILILILLQPHLDFGTCQYRFYYIYRFQIGQKVRFLVILAPKIIGFLEIFTFLGDLRL